MDSVSGARPAARLRLRCRELHEADARARLDRRGDRFFPANCRTASSVGGTTCARWDLAASQHPPRFVRCNHDVALVGTCSLAAGGPASRAGSIATRRSARHRRAQLRFVGISTLPAPLEGARPATALNAFHSADALSNGRSRAISRFIDCTSRSWPPRPRISASGTQRRIDRIDDLGPSSPGVEVHQRPSRQLGRKDRARRSNLDDRREALTEQSWPSNT